jgi:Rieske Fe-S protein
MRATETTRGPRVPTLPRRVRVPRAARVARIRPERSLRFSPPRPWIGRASWQEAGSIKIPPSRAPLTSAPPSSPLSQGDATYIVVKDDGSIEKYGINAVCTHLGCVVPWNKAENKFKCPCHGSQYNNEGKVIRGPAPLSLALAHAEINETDTIIFSPWTETDFRTGLEPWWK